MVPVQDYRQGMIDGLELALNLCFGSHDFEEAVDKIEYYLKLVKEDKFEKIRMELGAL